MSQPPIDPDQPTSSEPDDQSGKSPRQNVPSGGDRHIAVGGNVDRSAVVSGDGNKVVVHNYVQAPSTPRSLTEQKLLSQVKAEVASRLQQSLHNAIFINLTKDAQPQQVVRLWDAEVKIGATPPQPLPEDITILQVFDRPDIAGRLLILGKPGAGKTTTQLELAQALCDRCEQQLNYPIPVLFNLSTWKESNQSIQTWLELELKSKYGLRRDIGAQWLKALKLLPLLDGLDELDPQRQVPCIHAINQFITGESAPMHLVVASRFEEYERLGTPLQLNGAICLRELTDRQIQNYLASANQLVLWNAIAEDIDLLKFVRQPLLLSMTVLAYQGEARSEWQSLKSSEARLEHLLDAYIMRMLEQSATSQTAKNKKQKSYSPRQTRLWLTWLAQQMERESQTEFLIERMQPSWLPTQSLQIAYKRKIKLNLKLLLGLLLGLFGLLFGLLFRLLSVLFSESGFEPLYRLLDALLDALLDGLFYGLFYGLAGLFLGLFFEPSLWLIDALFKVGRSHPGTDVISISESLKWSWKEVKKVLVGLLVGELVVGLVAGLLFGRVFVIKTLLSVPLLILYAGLSSSEIEQKAFPNQGVWKTLQIGMIQVLICGLIGGLIGGQVVC